MKSYQEKYLKYKTKYDKLAKLIGGAGWICPACTFINNDLLTYCEICGAQKPVAVQPVAAQVVIPPIIANQVVAAPARVDKTFYVYTTGIAEWGDLEKAAKSWDTILRSTVLKNIHPSFNKIIIKHYDPLTGMEEAGVARLQAGISEIVVKDIIADPQREIQSEFIRGTIDFAGLSRPHLLLDLAHIFKYLPDRPKLIQIAGHYGEAVADQLQYDTISSVYPGYCGALQVDGGFAEQFIAHSDFFKTDADGNVITYIDRIFALNYNTDQERREGKVLEGDIGIYPSSFIRYVYTVIRIKAMNRLRVRKGNIAGFDELFTNEFSKNITIEIVRSLMNNDLTLRQLIDAVYAEKVHTHIEAI